MRKIYLLILTSIIFSCNQIGVHSPFKDVYRTFPIGTKLNNQILNSSEQILLLQSGIMLLCDISKDIYDSEYYILSFDNDLILDNAFYLSSNGIEKISKNIIYAFKSPVYDERKPSRRNTLPGDFKLKFIDCGTGTYHKQGKLIDDIYIVKDSLSSKISVSISYTQGEENYYSSFQELKNAKNAKTDQAFYNLAELHFDEESIYTISCNNTTRNIDYDHFLTSPGTLEKLRLEIEKIVLK